ncbi:hypothetical protein DPMN_002951 [Dreissena polymorpha]|uniref:Uncharacterized protein n=1 Tax=Dreissena polymorpha TaxID=45954 RepID=A0A9D4MKN0_DREPO|nr:hypothetical protein DPMN_002951 [Dreissena polymorpha]
MFLTKFHDDRTINVASRVLTTKKYRAPLQSYIIDTNILTKFDDDWRINVASRVLTRKNTKPSCGHVFKYIIEINLLIQFYEDCTINMDSRGYALRYKKHARFGGIWDIEVMSIFGNLNAKCDGKTDGQTDGQTERQTDGQSDHYAPFSSKGGIKRAIILTKCLIQTPPPILPTSKLIQSANVKSVFNSNAVTCVWGDN